jgi:tetratricopeptide (TPR) repeat protein
MRRTPALVVALIVSAIIPAASAQPAHPMHTSVQAIPLEILERPVPLRSGIGVAREPVTTKSAAAHAMYEQGLAHLHSFMWIEAARSFHAALQLDRTLAMSHLGLSFAFGGLGSIQGARQALEQARTLSAPASERDRLRNALRGQYAIALAAEQRGDRSTAVQAYAQALQRWSEADPDLFELGDARRRLAALTNPAR